MCNFKHPIYFIIVLCISAPNSRLTDVHKGILENCDAVVDLHDASKSLPSFETLLKYDAIITFSFLDYVDYIAYGNLLARYQQSGRLHRVILSSKDVHPEAFVVLAKYAIRGY